MQEDIECLIYVSSESIDVRGNNIYKLYFSDNYINAEGEGWYEPIAYNNALEPNKNFISSDTLIVTDRIRLSTIQDSEQINLSYLDACEGIIAIAWEDVNCVEFEQHNNGEHNRLFFRYGETKESVIDKLLDREITLKASKYY